MFRKVTAGQPFEPSATTYNAMVDAAVDFRARQGGNQGIDQSYRSPERLQLRAVAHNDLAAYSVSLINGVAIEPDETDTSGFATPVLNTKSSASPATGDTAVVFTHGVTSGKIGNAVISGITGARIKVTNAAHQYAVPGADNQFESTAAREPVRVLFKPAIPGGETEVTGIGVVLLGLDTGIDIWRYRLLEDSLAPDATAAKLVTLAGVDVEDIDLLDPISLMDDQILGEVGYCFSHGGQYYALQAPC